MEHSNPNRDADELDALRRLYPELSPEELEEAMENLRRYARLMVRAYERIRHDPEAYAELLKITDELLER